MWLGRIVWPVWKSRGWIDSGEGALVNIYRLWNDALRWRGCAGCALEAAVPRGDFAWRG